MDVRGDTHRTASRILDILELLAESNSGHALRDLSRGLTAPKSSLLPLLRTLTARGYIAQDNAGAYRLGTKLLELTHGISRNMDLPNVGHPLLADLAAQTGEATILVRFTSDRGAVVYIDKIESVHQVRVSVAIGDTRPLHSTSSGKLLLAFLPAEEQNAALAKLDMPAITAKTNTNIVALRRELNKIRADGYCINVDQSVMGQGAMAAPVMDRYGSVVAACVISAPKERFTDRRRELLRELLNTARTMSYRLGYRQQPNVEHRPAQSLPAAAHVR